jgi:hypothetical protein
MASASIVLALDPRIDFDDTIFWRHVEFTETCHLWIGSRNHHGYGTLGRSINGCSVAYLVHRYAWEKRHGPIPFEQMVLHTCDVRNCVRDDHLFLGNQFVNMLDMMVKGRARGAEGEMNYGAKLTIAQVLEIRRRADAGFTNIELAKIYAVDRTTIWSIVTRRKWKSIPEIKSY